MNYAIVGGDRRSVLLAEILAADGHRVYCFANEKGGMTDCVKCRSLSSCLNGAESVILPIPAEKSGFLNAPLSDERIKAEELIAELHPGQRLFGGGISGRLSALAASGGVQVFDFLQDESFAAANALLTAEAAVGLLIHDCDRAVSGSRALVLGYGRVGRELASRLKALGSDVTVTERNETVLKEAERAGMHTFLLTELENRLSDFDFILNTVPARILSDSALCSAAENAVLMELASAPGGFDRKFAENIGLKTIAAPGLPGRFSPRSSAQYIKKLIYSALSAGEE